MLLSLKSCIFTHAPATERKKKKIINSGRHVSTQEPMLILSLYMGHKKGQKKRNFSEDPNTVFVARLDIFCLPIPPIFSISLRLFSSPAPRRGHCPSSHTSCFKGAAFLTCLTSLLHFYTPHFFFFCVFFFCCFFFCKVIFFGPRLCASSPHCLALPRSARK